MEKDFSVRGALKRLKSITVLDLRIMKEKDLDAIRLVCTELSKAAYDELQRRPTSNSPTTRALFTKEAV